VLWITFGEVALGDRPGAVAAIGGRKAFGAGLEARQVLGVRKSPGYALILCGIAARAFGWFSRFKIADGVVAARSRIAQQARVDGRLGSPCTSGQE